MLELLGMPYRQRKARTEQLLEEFDITHIRKSRAARCPVANDDAWNIARCLVSDPQIIMLDEPFAGIDPVPSKAFSKFIAKLRDQGISILITDHAAAKFSIRSIVAM